MSVVKFEHGTLIVNKDDVYRIHGIEYTVMGVEETRRSRSDWDQKGTPTVVLGVWEIFPGNIKRLIPKFYWPGDVFALTVHKHIEEIAK